jgi:hypothetical protein
LTDFPKIDAEILADTLEATTDLHEMIAAVIRLALVDEALGVGLRARMEHMKERLSRLEVGAGKKREVALHAMCEVGLTKLEQSDFTASIRAGSPALVVLVSKLFLRPTGCHSRQSSIGRFCLESSSVVL